MRKRKREQSCVDFLLCFRFFFFSFATVYLVHLVSYHVTFPVILVLLLSVNAFNDAISKHAMLDTTRDQPGSVRRLSMIGDNCGT